MTGIDILVIVLIIGIIGELILIFSSFMKKNKPRRKSRSKLDNLEVNVKKEET